MEETHCTTPFPAGVKDEILCGLFLGSIFGSGLGALCGVIWVLLALLGDEGASLPLGGGLLGGLIIIPLSIVAGVAILSLVFGFVVGILGIFSTNRLKRAKHTFTVRSPWSRTITINATVDVVWENIIQPEQARWLFNGNLENS